MGRRDKIRIDVNDIVGKRVGKLKINCYAKHKYTMTSGGMRVRHFYVCECDCGRVKFIQRGPLLNHIVYSCGCSRRNKRRK